MATFAGQNRGIEAYERIKKGANCAFVLSTAYAILIFGVVMLFRNQLIALFVTENLAEIEEYTTIYMKILGSSFTLLGMIFIYRNILQGCGYAIIPTLGGVFELVARAIVAAIAAQNHSYRGVVAAHACAWIAAALFLWISYMIIFRKITKQGHF